MWGIQSGSRKPVHARPVGRGALRFSDLDMLVTSFLLLPHWEASVFSALANRKEIFARSTVWHSAIWAKLKLALAHWKPVLLLWMNHGEWHVLSPLFFFQNLQDICYGDIWTTSSNRFKKFHWLLPSRNYPVVDSSECPRLKHGRHRMWCTTSELGRPGGAAHSYPSNNRTRKAARIYPSETTFGNSGNQETNGVKLFAWNFLKPFSTVKIGD